MADENIKQQGDYYYDVTPDVEDIDSVLIDLVKILKSGSLDDKISVNISTEKEQKEEDEEPRYHFELGDGGKIDVPQDLDRILSSDGEGGLKLNEGIFYSKINSNVSIPVSILETPYPKMEIKLEGGMEESYWGYKHKGSFVMEQSPKVQFLGNPALGSPVFSMTNRGIIDIHGGVAWHENGVRPKIPAPWLSTQAYNYYSNVWSPLGSGRMSDDGLVYPYFMMKESATALLEGSSLLHICGGSSLFMDGNADVRITGSYADGGQEYQRGRTYVNIDPGSTFIMTSLISNEDTNKAEFANAYNPVFLMTNAGQGQIMFTTQGDSFNAEVWGSYRNFSAGINAWNTVNWSGLSGILSFSKGDSAMKGMESSFVRNKLSMKPPSYSRISNIISDIHQPTFGLQGKTNIILGDNGTLAMRIAANTDGAIIMDWTSEGNTAIKMGNEKGATSVYEIVPAENSNTHFKFSPDKGSAAVIAIEPHGNFSFKVSPENSCGISFTPINTDIVCQWENFEGIFEGTDVFAQIEGNSHFEFLNDSTIIMRGPGAEGWNAKTRQNTSLDTAIKIVTSTNCDGYTYEEFWNTLSDSEKVKVNKFLCPNSSSHSRQVIDGTVTATEFYPDRYNIVLGGIVVNKNLASHNFYFYAPTENSNVDVIVNWSEFKNAVKRKYGKDATATEVNIEEVAWSNAASSYIYDIQAKIENASLSYNSETQYEIGASFNNLTEIDKEKNEFKHKDLWDFSTATVISNDVRSDMKYINVCQDYTYKTGTHLIRDWEKPVSTQTGPISQMYGLSNFCMRGMSKRRFSKIQSFTISPTKTYDFTMSLSELITDFINGTDYASFVISYEEYLTNIENVGFHFDHIISINQSEQGLSVTAIFEYELVEHQRTFSPLIEIIGESEIRVANGISIKTDNVDGKSVIKIEAPERHISFTMDELQKLKDLISST